MRDPVSVLGEMRTNQHQAFGLAIQGSEETLIGSEPVRIRLAPGAARTYDRRMSPKETVLALYAAYGSRDPEQITALLAPDVVWIAPPGNATQVGLGLGAAADAGPPRGANNLDRALIVTFMAYNFGRFFSAPVNEFRAVVAEGGAVFVEHHLSATLPDGRPYVNDYCFAYEVADGRVTEIREYMDTRGGWAQVFGDGAGGRLLDFVTQ